MTNTGSAPSLTSRRRALALIGAAASVPALPAFAYSGPRLAELTLYGPPAGPSVTVAHAVATGALAPLIENASFKAWRNPDELRAGLTSGSIQMSVVPVQAAANLYNRGFPIRLANVMTNGLLYVVTKSPDVISVEALKGLKVSVPFRGDTPEVLFNQLLDHAGIDREKDLEISFTGTPVESMQMLLADRVDAALLAEPASTAASLKARMSGKSLYRSINMQEALGAMTGGAPVVPQAGLAVTGSFLDENLDMVPAIHEVLKTATAEVLENPMQAASNATAALGMPAPLLGASVPHSNLVARSASEARADIEHMLGTMTGPGMKKIGGKLPDDGFYI